MELDVDQQQITNHFKGNSLVLAGAGAGKTRCIVSRIANLIRNGVSPKRILALTFTNKAAGEMKGRLFDLLGREMGMPTATTFHSFGFKFIHKNAEACGRRAWASLLDASDAKFLLRDMMELSGINIKDKELLGRIEQVYDLAGSAGIDIPFTNEEDTQLFELMADNAELSAEDRNQIIATRIAYDAEKVEQNIIDYDDLINLPRKALENNADLQQKVGSFLVDITVDESQDNNRSQYKLMKLLAGPSTSVMMVGDDDQSIYQFRGAAPECMQAFQDDFKPEIFRLERNYRSAHEIVDSASNMVKMNVNRIEKNPYAVGDLKEAPNATGWVRHDDDRIMARKVAKSIRADINQGRKFGDIAILYRVNAMAQIMEKALMAEGIPYTIKRAITMLERKEIRLLTAMIRLTHNRTDGFAFATMAETIQGLGAKRIEAMLETGTPFHSGLVKGAVQEKIDKLEAGLDRLKKEGPRKLFEITAQTIDLKFWLTKRAGASTKAKRDQSSTDLDAKKMSDDKIREYVSNMNLLQECVNDRIESIEKDFGELDLEELWAEAMEVITESPEESSEDDTSGRVTLSTVHGSKGLEWPIVHCAGMSSTMFPLGEDPDLEEERRLAYVMITRAKEKAIAHHPESIFMYGQRTELMPSRFLTELGFTELDDVPLNKIYENNSISTGMTP